MAFPSYEQNTASKDYDGFSQEDVWHEMRALGCDERQAVRSLNEAHARLDD